MKQIMKVKATTLYFAIVLLGLSVAVSFLSLASNASERSVQEFLVGSAVKSFPATISEAMPHIDKLIVINLKRRPDRLQTFANRFPFSLQGLQVLEAFDGKMIQEELLDPYKKESLQMFMRTTPIKRSVLPAELGCSLSHYCVWRIVSAMPQNSKVAVFEDDANFDRNFPDVWKSIASAWRAPQSSVQFLYLGGRFRPQFQMHGETMTRASSLPHCVQQPQAFENAAVTDRTTCAYALTPTAAKELLRYNHSDFLPVDHALQTVLRNSFRADEVAHANPLLVWSPLNVASDIQNTKGALDQELLQQLLA